MGAKIVSQEFFEKMVNNYIEESSDAKYLALTGGTISGILNINNNVNISNKLTSSSTIAGTIMHSSSGDNYAAFLPRGESVSVGDIIAIDETSTSTERYIKASTTHKYFVGVCTDNCSHIISGNSTPVSSDFITYNASGYIATAIAGRVWVKVLNKSIINIGNYIGVSSTAGTGTVVTNRDDAIGIVVAISSSENKVKIKLL